MALLAVAGRMTGHSEIDPPRGRRSVSGLPTNRPEPAIYTFRTPSAQVAETGSHEVSGGGWNELAKAPITSSLVGPASFCPRTNSPTAQNSEQPANPTPPSKAAVKDALANWYREHLGIGLTPTSGGEPVWEQEAGKTVFT